jgi:hypothetical protein
VTAKTPSVVFTGVLLAGTVAFAQNTTGQQNPYATGTQTGTMGQQAPYATGTTNQTQITGTVTSLKPNNEITVRSTTGETHTYNLSPRAATVSPNVTQGSQVVVTESTAPNGQKTTTITPAPGAAATNPYATGTSGTTGTSGQTGGTGY